MTMKGSMSVESAVKKMPDARQSPKPMRLYFQTSESKSAETLGVSEGETDRFLYDMVMASST
jgi:hypothetical protein